MHSTPRFYRKFAGLLAALAVAVSASAQVGANWNNLDPLQYLHSQQHNTNSYPDVYHSLPTGGVGSAVLRSQWNYTSHNHNLGNGTNSSGHYPAEYRRNASLDEETFSLWGNTTDTGNRVEMRIVDNYGPGQKRQLEGYVTCYAPMDHQSYLQIWGSEDGASQLMGRMYENNEGGGTGSNGVMMFDHEPSSDWWGTNLYGTERKINVVHIQNSAVGQNNGRIVVYVDGVKRADFVDNEDPDNTPNSTNYMKYGIYQTITAGHENPKVVWKNVRFYQGGAAPGSTTQTITVPNNLETTGVTKIVGDANFSLNATASSSLGVTYRSSNLAVATITTGNQIQIVGAGQATIWVNQNGNGTYAPAPSKKVQLTVTTGGTTQPAALFEKEYYTDLTSSSSITTPGNFSGAQNKLTVAFWVRADSATVNQQPIDKLPATWAANNQGWSLKFRNNGAIWFRMGAENSFRDIRTAAGAYAAGSWVHVTCTFDGTTQKIYLNGTQATTTTTTNVPNTFTVVGTTNLSIGRPSVVNPTAEIFSGDLRDVRFYDRALNNTEIGVLAIQPQWLYNGPRSFNGTATDYVEAGDAIPGSGASLTVALFVDADALQNQQPVDKLPNLGTGGGWSVKLRTDSSLWFRIGTEASNTTIQAPTSAYAPNTKVHVACTFTGGTAKVYYDGVEQTSVTMSGITKSVSNTAIKLRLAVPSEAATANIFQGELSRVRVYHQALTAAQIGLLADGL